MKRILPQSEVLSFSAEYQLEMSTVGVSRGISFDPVTGDDLLSAGLFGGSNNANVFIPNVDVKNDIYVKPEDFVRVPFRLLSATIVGGGSWKATNFSNTEVLKASREKLVGKPVYFDHDQELLNWVGVIESVTWEESYTADDGKVIPGGINGILLLDAKTNPKIVRGIQMGAIFSNSVTVSMSWVPSHEFENMDGFYDKVGSMHADGRMVTRDVTGIKDYYESSLVWLGADPYAKLINGDGQLVNPDYTNSVSFSKEKEDIRNKYNDKKNYAINFCLDEKIISLSKSKPKSASEPKTISDMKQLIALFISLGFAADENGLKTLIGLDASEEITEDNLKAFLQAERVDPSATPDARLASFDALVGITIDTGEETTTELAVDTEGISKDTHTLVKTSVLENAKTEAQKYKDLGDVAKLQANAQTGKDYLEAKRSEVERLYKLSAGDDADEAVIGLIAKATSAELDGLLKQHVKGATEKFSGSCKKCGSNEFQFRSSVNSFEEEPTGDEVMSAGKSLQELAAEKTRSPMFMGGKSEEKSEDK